MKATLRNTISEVYQKNNSNGYKIKNSFNNNGTVNTSNNIKMNNANNIKIRNNNIFENAINEENMLSNMSTSNDVKNGNGISYFWFILLFVAIIVGLVIYYFRKQLIQYFKTLMHDEKQKEKNDKLNNELEELKKKIGEQEKKQLEKEKHDEENKDEEKPKKKQDKNLKKLYSENQFVKENGYCYIGTDDNMRHCIEAYDGNICESGDIYKRIDDCLIPK
jgi:regulator of replication initiation timing